ncbi:MAG: YARHG domain-containing protein, partial [Bdellovibrionota bacterium]
MRKIFLFACSLIVLSAPVSGMAKDVHHDASHKAFPDTFAKFEKMTFEEMKSLPEAKWTLNKKVTAEELKGKNETEVILLRNSVYAQHGFRFSQKALANYFLTRTWYKPDTDSLNVDKLSKLSRDNVET